MALANNRIQRDGYSLQYFSTAWHDKESGLVLVTASKVVYNDDGEEYRDAYESVLSRFTVASAKALVAELQGAIAEAESSLSLSETLTHA